MPFVRRGFRTDMLPVMRALDARIQDATAPLQGSKLLRLLTEDFGSVGVLFEGESSFYQQKHNLLELLAEDFGGVGVFSEGDCLRTGSASSFYQKKHHQSTTLCTTAKKRPMAPPRARRRREKMQIMWLPTSPIHFQ